MSKPKSLTPPNAAPKKPARPAEQSETPRQYESAIEGQDLQLNQPTAPLEELRKDPRYSADIIEHLIAFVRKI